MLVHARTIGSGEGCGERQANIEWSRRPRSVNRVSLGGSFGMLVAIKAVVFSDSVLLTGSARTRSGRTHVLRRVANKVARSLVTDASRASAVFHIAGKDTSD